MKLSKKILTFVAPIAATTVVAPIITSCNNESFEFTYGDSINCLRSFKKGEEFQDVTLHSLSKVKEVSISHAFTWPDDTVTSTVLAAFPSETKLVYYDLVASLAQNYSGFALLWKDDEAANPTLDSLKILFKDSEILSVSDAVIKYEEKTPAGGTTKIYMEIFEGEPSAEDEPVLQIASYTFRNVKISE